MNKEEKREAKLREKNRREQEKLEIKKQKEMIKEEKERIRNSFGYKFKTFIFTIVFAIILIIVAFFGLKYYLNEKQNELYNEEMAYYLEQGEKLLGEKKFEEAINMFSKIEEDSDLYEEAQNKLNETVETYLEEYNNIAEIYISEGNYDKAIDLFESLPDSLKETAEVKESIANIELSRIQNEIKDLTDSYDVLVAISENISLDLSQETINKINEFLNTKIDSYEEEVKNSISSKTYEKYINEIEELVKLYPENIKINDLLEFVKSYEPQSLLSLSYQVENETIEISNNQDTVTDSENKKYTSYILVNESNTLVENTISWSLDGTYSTLSGKICLSNEVEDLNSDGVKITVYGDNKSIYKSKKIRNTTKPFNFNVDISGVKELKIVLESDKGITYFIANPVISK